MQVGGTGAEVFRRLGDIILRRCGGKRLTRTGREERGGPGGEEREQPYRQPRVIGIGVKVQRVDNCMA